MSFITMRLPRRVFRHIGLLLWAVLLAWPVSALADDEDSRRFTIVIDAGHGGHDAGAVGSRGKEKDINLAVALETGRLLKTSSPDIRIVYTRQTDVFIPLQTRADIANRNKADLFVSIHTNALPKGRIAYGAETYTLGMARAAANLEVAKRENAVITYEKDYKVTYEGFDPNKAESYIIFELMQDRYMKQSVELARAIQQQYVSSGRQNKGVHQAGFLVLRKTSMPAVLTELGFISTPEEETYLLSSAGQSALARSIAAGIQKYIKTHAGNVAATFSPLIAPDKIDNAEPEGLRVPEAPKSESRPTVNVESKAESQATKTEPKPTTTKTATKSSGKPVFKVQLFATDGPLKAGDRRFKSLSPVDSYRENGLYKYTYGATTSYADIKQTQRDIAAKFPDTFIVAFLDGERINLAEAIKLAKRQ